MVGTIDSGDEDDPRSKPMHLQVYEEEIVQTGSTAVQALCAPGITSARTEHPLEYSGNGF